MKFYFLIFVIAVMVQASAAGPISRYKRSELFVDIFQESIRAVNQLLPSTETLFKNALKEIPKTPAYAKYVQLFEGYLTEMEKFKKNRGNCLEKKMAMIEKFIKVAQEIDLDTPEAKEIDRILDNNGVIQMLKDIEEFGEKLNTPEAEKALEDATHEDALKFAPLLSEVC